ncbi:MAG: hypothetical protein QXG39_09365 [Candidatus Aenigmatarchaeota archaeon]
MAEFKSFRSYGMKRRASCYWSLSRKLNSIWSQNEQIISKLKDIEELLNRFAETLVKQDFREEKNS